VRRRALVAVAVVALALLARGVAAARTSVIQRDGVQWVNAARAVGGPGRSGHEPPGYPFLVAAVARVRGGTPGEADAQAASALSGALLVVAVGLVAARTYGRKAGVAAALVAAVHPATVGLGSAALADGLAAAFDAWAVVAAHAALEGRRARILAPVAGTLAAAGYLVRPEGVVVLAAILLVLAAGPRAERGARARGRDVALALLPVALVALPYILAIRSQPLLGGGGEGQLKLTLKRDLFRDAGLDRVFHDGGIDATGAGEVLAQDLGRAREQTWLAVAALDPLGIALALAAVAAARARHRSGAPPNAPARRLVALHAAIGAALFLAFVAFHAEPRYGARLAALALPHLGAGLVALGERLAPAIGPRALAVVASVAVAIWTPIAVHERDRAKATWRIAGEALRGHDVRRVAAMDPRPAFYAGAEHVDLYVPLHEANGGLDRVVATLERTRADAVVLGNKGEQGELVLPLARRLGREPEAIGAPGAEPVVIIRVSP
jgi:4-amino-4-deoxy-L-arabinose transferase-like glycosyltransferase